MPDHALRTAALASKAWPYEEARKLLKRWPEGKPAKDGKPAPLVFETGYGPSGLPHIGTFNEVLRTTMVRNAFATISDMPTRLIEFSDDMDGLRKVPDNVPNGAMLAEHLGRPLSKIPDPFGTHKSFAAHNNARLRDFLDGFGFDYEFVSSTQAYESGAFDDALRGVLRNFEAIMGVMLPTLRAERAATYSPIMPISPKSGVVLQVPVEVIDAEVGTIRFTDDGETIEQSALGGQAKLQWKVDWAMRWVALGVDYEMYGKDLIDSGTQSGKIARILGGQKPDGLIYEMFLDERGEKISKSKGNGLSLDDWLKYGTRESVAFYAYREPKAAKQLSLAVVPKAVDEYFQFREKYAVQPVEQQLGNPVHHIHDGDVPTGAPPVTFGLLLNLASVLGPEANAFQMLVYLQKLSGVRDDFEGITPDQASLHRAFARLPAGDDLSRLVDLALAYNRDFVAPTLKRRAPVGVEIEALKQLDAQLSLLPPLVTDGDLQNIVYAVGNESGFENLRDWFRALYETLLGSAQGPRMGSFIALYGVANTRRLIGEALETGGV